VGCTTGSRGEVPVERKSVIRDDDDDDNNNNNNNKLLSSSPDNNNPSIGMELFVSRSEVLRSR
jgi:hypothetical protein